MVVLQLTKCSVLGKLFKFQALISPSVKWGWASQVTHWQRIHLLNRGFRFSPWIRKIPWRRKCQPTPVFLPGESHGQRSLAGYSPQDCRRVGHNLKMKQQQQQLLAQMVKCLPAMRETQVQSLDREDPLEKEMATHSSTLAWKIPGTEEPGRLQSMGSQRVGHD